MAAYLKFPSKDDWQVLIRYLDNEGCIIIPPNVAEELAKALNMDITDVPRELEDTLIEYDFGGEPDVYVDIAANVDGFPYGEVLAHFKPDDEEEIDAETSNQQT